MKSLTAICAIENERLVEQVKKISDEINQCRKKWRESKIVKESLQKRMHKYEQFIENEKDILLQKNNNKIDSCYSMPVSDDTIRLLKRAIGEN